MAIELNFHKNDNSPWGFRLTGGADCDVPLTVIKVVEESIADINGLKVGDVIVRINETSVADYAHADVHDLIAESGNDLIFAVRRDYYDDEEDENNNLEVLSIMNGVHEQEQSELTATNERQSSISSSIEERIAEAISGQAEVLPDQNIIGVNFNKVDLSQSTVLQVMEEHQTEGTIQLQHKKWSAFLQKPERPLVKPKSKSKEQFKEPPYQVVIKKQKRRNLLVDTKVFSPEPEVEPEPDPEYEPEPQYDENNDCNIIQTTDHDESTENYPTSDNDDREGSEPRSDIEGDDERKSISETEEVKNDEEKEEVEVPLSTEEQLAQIQMQLQVLGQLPPSVQESLASVTKQLTKILYATQQRLDDERNLDSANVSRDDSLERSMEDISNIKEESDGEDEKEIAEDDDEYNSNASEASDKNAYFNDETATPVEEFDEEPHEPEIDYAELERLRLEAEKTEQKERSVSVLEESHQRRLEQRPTNPLAPVQRPIILPGGRKWAQPNDAMPVRKKKSSMSDERIVQTLDNYSEIIVGHTKGINFLKYQPPTKNLDYLQKSEVYKLLHDMDPPPRGIASRPEIVASEQDYYTTNK